MARSRGAKPNKAARAEAKAARKAASKERRSQLWQAFNIQRKEDKRLLPYMLGAFVLIVAIAAAIGVFSGGLATISMPALGVVLGAVWWRSSSSAGARRNRSTARPTVKPEPPPGRWTTCAASGA